MPGEASPPPSARARARRRLREEITDEALALVAERGFEAVTADEIARAVGVSRRTLFRLFATKEDVVVAAFEDLGDEAVAALRARPAEEPAWTALRRALDVVVRRLETRSATFLALHPVVARSPALRARLLEGWDGWRAGFARELGRRAGRRRSGLRDELAAAAAIVAFDVASARWARAGGRRRLGGLLDEAFGALGAGLAAA